MIRLLSSLFTLAFVGLPLGALVACGSGASSEGVASGDDGGAVLLADSGGDAARGHHDDGGGRDAGGDAADDGGAMPSAGAGGAGGSAGSAGTGGTGGSAGVAGTSSNPFVGSCTGTPSAAVVSSCTSFAVDQQCSPLAGCRPSGSCEARLSQNDCVVRGVNGCGVGVGDSVCHVEPGDNFPASAVCVQTDRAAKCATQGLYLQGTCLAFDDGDNVDGGLCKWVDGGNATCIAAECESHPIQFYCEMVDGCTWNL